MLPAPLPRAPSPKPCRTCYRAHSRHSALWAVAPGSVAQARPHSCAALGVPHGVKALEKEDRCAAKLHGLCLPSPRSASRRVLSCGDSAAPVPPPDNGPSLNPGGTSGSGPLVRCYRTSWAGPGRHPPGGYTRRGRLPITDTNPMPSCTRPTAPPRSPGSSCPCPA